MTLMERVAEDMKTAMKARDRLRLETLRMVRAQLLEKQVEKRPLGVITQEDEMAVLISASKKRKEAIEIYAQAGRMDLSDHERKELEIIQEYLPKQLTLPEVEDVVRRVAAEIGVTSSKDMGKVMSAVMKELKGRAEGKLVQETVKRILEG